jgi:hypothetical protein
MAVLEAITGIGAGIQANEVAKRNAAIDEADARVAVREGRASAALEQRRGLIVQAEQAVRFAGAGIAPGEGTPLQLAAQESVRAELRGAEELRAGLSEAERRKQSAALQRARGKAAKKAGFIRAGAALLGKPIQKLGSGGLVDIQGRRAERRFS